MDKGPPRDSLRITADALGEVSVVGMAADYFVHVGSGLLIEQVVGHGSDDLVAYRMPGPCRRGQRQEKENGNDSQMAV